ncbi:uncharacterized protein TM35_000063200 [Trypanosoma theileri]|uniref:Calponin-homology (CH) domain-containing protein n=1 Tax=Trypanosoma theileri TaxID=67003 RepID=A0A1X0P353_9TRYP|nr:uncharacterized protein TM35_000063200 [Trypanosoma theileri]ORC91315.1 hypothetical protein TM35_000063200 [Trypanosoma theileri]
MSTVSFTESDKNDLREFYRIYDFAKVNSVDHTVETCIDRNITPQQLFEDLYKLHHVTQLPDRLAAAQRLRDAVPTATDEDVESVLRHSEMSQLAECDALRALRRRLGVKSNTSLLPLSLSSTLLSTTNTTATTSIQQSMPLKKVTVSSSQDAPSTTAAIPSKTTTITTTTTTAIIDNGDDNSGGRVKQLNAGPTRAVMDEIMTAECRDWVAQVVGDVFNADVLKSENFVDSLRSGVVLLVLLQKLRDPPVPDNELKIPKRSIGFFARDNVISFLKEARKTYDLVEAQLFTDSDLCDGKNDRAVVTCLLSIARIAYTRGSTKLAPAMIMYEQEIDAKMKNVTQQQIDEVILAAEASESASDVLEEEEEECVEKEKEPQPSIIPVVNEDVQITESPTPIKEKEKGEKNENIEVDHIINPISNVNPVEPLTSIKEPDDLATEGGRDENEKETGMTMTETTNTPAKGSDDTSPVDIQIDKKEKEELKDKKTGRIFYLRGGAIGEDLEKLPTTPPKSLQRPTSSQLSPRARSGNVNISTTQTTQAPPKYRPRRWDEIDTVLSIVVNAHFTQHPLSQIRFRRLSSTAGEYVVYHRALGHKRLLYARIIQGKLMIRPTANNSGGAPTWMDLQQWLDRYEKELEVQK